MLLGALAGAVLVLHARIVCPLVIVLVILVTVAITAVARPRAMGSGSPQVAGESVAGAPLLFYRGRYGMTAAQPEEGPPEIVDTLLAWPRHADWM